MNRALAIVAAGSLLVSASGDGMAQQKDREDKPAPNKRGAYSGVKPGEGAAPGRRARKRKKTVSWVGFQRQPERGARLFVQLSSELAFTQDVVGDKLIVQLEGARYGARNARRRLDVRFFDTALAQVSSKRVSRRRARKGRPARKAGIQLTIAFKNKADAATARASLTQEKDGFYYLYLDFDPPKGEVEIRPSDDQS